MTVFKFSTLTSRLALTAAAITIISGQAMAAQSVTVYVAIGQTATVSTANYIVANDGDTLHKTGIGTLNITADQGQGVDKSAQEGFSGIFSLDAGKLSIGHNNALGNGKKYKSGESPKRQDAESNYLLMSDATTLSASDTIGNLAVPIKLYNMEGSASVTIDCHGHDMQLNKISGVDNVSNTLNINFVNTGESGHIVTLFNTYTRGTDDDKMIIDIHANVSVASAALIAPNVQLKDGSQLSITASMTLPKITVSAL